MHREPSNPEPQRTGLRLSLSFGSLGCMRTRLLQTIAGATLVFACVRLAHAHEDTLIELKGTELVGLPKNYVPAELDIKASRLRMVKARNDVLAVSQEPFRAAS
jgi:hypothetical protein